MHFENLKDDIRVAKIIFVEVNERTCTFTRINAFGLGYASSQTEVEFIFRALQGPLIVHCIRIRAAAVRTEAYPELCSVYTEFSLVAVHRCTETTLQSTSVYFQCCTEDSKQSTFSAALQVP